MTDEPEDFVPGQPRCPLPAVGRWTWYPTDSHQASRLPGVTFCRFHEAAAKLFAAAKAPEDGRHYLHRDVYADNVDHVRCQAPAVYDAPVAELDADRLAGLVDEARTTLQRITRLAATAQATVALVGNEDPVLDALVGLAVDAAAEADVVRARVEGRTQHLAP